MEGHFVCINCGKKVNFDALGTRHRDHCPFCLWSVHLDFKTPGDREAKCGGAMKPVGITFKSEGGKKQGELEVVELCQRCGSVGKNRLAGDDVENEVIEVYRESLEKGVKEIEGIHLLQKEDAREIMTQLFGKPKVEVNLKEFGF